jgi:hypothetical protein
MKKVLLISIVIYSFLYLGVSIANSTFNLLNWDKEGQLLVYVFGTMASGWILIDYKTTKSI